MVFYRKYRPQKIAELDSEVIRERLYSVLADKTIAHAFLFTGPKGLGKTSAARILAKAVNCEEKSKVKSQKSKVKSTNQKSGDDDKVVETQIEPCNECSQCISITNGNNLDVFEIDAASNRGIDEIRDIKEKLRLAPGQGAKKIYIIDEVHMLTQEAFNALLKTLEEPPEHVLFILCTTEPSKIPETIISRCFHVSFKQASKEELVRSFERIVKGEDIDIERSALYYIADLSEGGFRDGAKILEELVQTFKGKKITKEAVEKKYHLVNSASYALSLIEAMQAKNTGESLKIISKIAEEGLEIKRIITDALTILHEALLVSAGVSDEASSLKLELSEISNMANLFTSAYSQVKNAVLPQLPLEIAVVEWVSLSNTKSDGAEVAHENFLVHSANNDKGLNSKSKSANAHSENFVGSSRLNVSAFLQELIEKTKAHNHSVSGLLRGCEIVSSDGKTLILGTKFKFHKEKLDEKKTQELLEKTCEEITGNKVKILVELKK